MGLAMLGFVLGGLCLLNHGLGSGLNEDEEDVEGGEDLSGDN